MITARYRSCSFLLRFTLNVFKPYYGISMMSHLSMIRFITSMVDPPSITWAHWVGGSYKDVTKYTICSISGAHGFSSVICFAIITLYWHIRVNHLSEYIRADLLATSTMVRLCQWSNPAGYRLNLPVASHNKTRHSANYVHISCYVLHLIKYKAHGHGTND